MFFSSMGCIYVCVTFSLTKPSTQSPMRLNCRVESRRRCECPLRQSWPSFQFPFLCCSAIEVGDKWRHNDVIVEKVIDIDRNSHSQTIKVSVSKLSTESAGSRRELVANSVHTADATTQLDSWVASAVCIGHKYIYNTIYNIRLLHRSQTATTSNMKQMNTKYNYLIVETKE